MILWHIGATIAIVRYAFRDDRMDLRFLIVGAVLADLVDTPIGAVGFTAFHSVRLAFHSLLLATLAMIAVLISTRRGRTRKRWMALAVGLFVHLVLDAMWANPETLWWPFLGLEFTPSGFSTYSDLARAVLTDWRVWSAEAAGAAYLVYLAVRGNLVSAAARRRFMTTGRIAVPIDRR